MMLSRASRELEQTSFSRYSLAAPRLKSHLGHWHPTEISTLEFSFEPAGSVFNALLIIIIIIIL